MDPIAASEAIKALSTALQLAKSAIELMPNKTKRMEALAAYQEAELKFKTAEAALAKEFGYRLCQRHWPPAIMLKVNEFEVKCQECGEKVNIHDKRWFKE